MTEKSITVLSQRLRAVCVNRLKWGDTLSDKIRFNTIRLKNDTDSIKENVDTILQLYSELVEKRAQLDAMWDGPASEAFKKAFGDDLVGLMTMISNMQRIYNYGNMSKECYENCENQVSGVISDI